MRTFNETVILAAPDVCFERAADVERWPEILPHYRDVRFTRRDGPDAGLVYMSAYRDFGPLPWPIWWESEMEIDRDALSVRYRHVRGITRGMDVEWRVSGAAAGGSRVEIVHEWEGPGWPLIGGFAARRVIGPHFVHVVAGRTLAGVKRAAEAQST